MPLRYLQSELQTRLAERYALGMQTLKVRLRCQQLLAELPSMEALVIQWEQRLQPLLTTTVTDDQLAQLNQQHIWQRITQQLPDQPALTKRVASVIQYWQHTLNQLALAACLLLMLWLSQFAITPHSTIPVLPHYMAVLRDARESPSLVVTSARLAPGHAVVKLFPQQALPVGATLGLWAEDPKGQRVLLGHLDSSHLQWTLSKPQWLAIASAERLLLVDSTAPHSVLWQGECQQLRAW
ncbi:hypothetical protein WH50_07875 [Pokkaliibacter plantistimulans]|uniref:DUF4115 domain-containing protein n=2 Tax=Pokkaliibacter plantistimulans TaxID=1635171 RepID=A0ABX5LYW1_9GAMM|nr:hypothetical protein WH50_07875 [Pokkaliibacter plantistimulans]